MSNEYWGKRLADKAFDRGSQAMIKELRKIYQNQAKSIQDKITDLYMKMIEDGGITTTNLYAYGRYTDLMGEIRDILNSYGEKEVKVISGGLEDAYKEAFGKTSETLGQTVKWGLQNTYLMEEAVNANFKGAGFSKRIWTNRDNLSKLLGKNIQDVIASGQSKDKAVKQIMKVEKSSFRNADRLVRTETMRVINDGQKQSFKANGYTHGYYIYSDDDRNCEECAKISKESRENPLPLDSMDAIHHPNCRCGIRPIVPMRTVFDIAKENGEYAKYEAVIAKNVKSDIISGTGKNEFKVGFKESNLNAHWGGLHDHSNEYPELDKQGYARQALELIQKPVGEGIIGYKNGNGQIIRYDKSANDFVKGHPDKGIATMFKPKRGIDYFNDWKLKEGEKESEQR